MQTAAYTQDRGDAVALNSLTTYYLHKWFPLPARAPLASLVEGQARVSVQADGSGRYGAWVSSHLRHWDGTVLLVPIGTTDQPTHPSIHP